MEAIAGRLEAIASTSRLEAQLRSFHPTTELLEFKKIWTDIASAG